MQVPQVAKFSALVAENNITKFSDPEVDEGCEEIDEDDEELLKLVLDVPTLVRLVLDMCVC